MRKSNVVQKCSCTHEIRSKVLRWTLLPLKTKKKSKLGDLLFERKFRFESHLLVFLSNSVNYYSHYSLPNVYHQRHKTTTTMKRTKKTGIFKTIRFKDLTKTTHYSTWLKEHFIYGNSFSFCSNSMKNMLRHKLTHTNEKNNNGQFFASSSILNRIVLYYKWYKISGLFFLFMRFIRFTAKTQRETTRKGRIKCFDRFWRLIVSEIFCRGKTVGSHLHSSCILLSVMF